MIGPLVTVNVDNVIRVIGVDDPTKILRALGINLEYTNCEAKAVAEWDIDGVVTELRGKVTRIGSYELYWSYDVEIVPATEGDLNDKVRKWTLEQANGMREEWYDGHEPKLKD